MQKLDILKAYFHFSNLQYSMTNTAPGIVVLGLGPQSKKFITKALKLCGDSAVLAHDVAGMAGATHAIGTPKALSAMRKKLVPGSTAATRRKDLARSDAAIQWLASGERGSSSNAIFARLTGFATEERGYRDGSPVPRDPADLRRCRLLLEQVPALEPEFRKRMARASLNWKALVASWDELCKTMDQETPDWRKGSGRAEKTYALMKSLGC